MLHFINVFFFLFSYVNIHQHLPERQKLITLRMSSFEIPVVPHHSLPVSDFGPRFIIKAQEIDYLSQGGPFWRCVCISHACVCSAVPNSLQSRQAPLSMGSSGQEYWSGLPFSSPGDLPKLEIKPASPALVSGFFTTKPLGKPLSHAYLHTI